MLSNNEIMAALSRVRDYEYKNIYLDDEKYISFFERLLKSCQCKYISKLSKSTQILYQLAKIVGFDNIFELEDGRTLAELTTEEKNKLAGIAAGAEVNVQADWAQTDDSADDFIKNKPTSLPADGGNADTVGGKTVNDAETGASYLWTAEKVKSYADGLLAANDAMSFKGVVNTSTPLPSEGMRTGDTYKVGEAGTYAGQQCEVGDMIICVDDAEEGDAKWQVIQTNIDGAVTSSAVTTSDGNIAVFDGTTGKLIKDGGATVASLQYTLPQATAEILGGVKASTLVTVTEGVLGLSDTVLLSTDEFIINGGTSAVE